MKIYKKLAGQTIIYGMGTIVPKILNYVILTSYYTYLFPVESFGILTELYAYVTFLMIILTYGTETGFFRFANDDNVNKVFGSLLLSLLSSSIFFIFIIGIFRFPIAHAINYQGQENYIFILAIIIGIDAFSTILFARLRKDEKSLKFSVLKIVNVVATVVAILFFYELVPEYPLLQCLFPGYNRADVLYVFLANLFASAVVLILLIPDIFRSRIQFDKYVLKKVLVFSFPLLIAGLAGTVNEALDRVLLKHLVPEDQALYILGIYGANYRIAMLLSVFVQMFRYAVEPFYFNYYGKKDEKEVYAKIMRLFIAVMIMLTMIILFYLAYIKFFIAERYHEGLDIIPIILCAFIFYGIFFNQSIWYKLTKHTGYAILLTLIGAGVTVIANVFFVRIYSYYAAAFGHFFAYLLMMIVSYFIGRRYYQIDYGLLRILEYIIVALAIFVLQKVFKVNSEFINNLVAAFFIIGYALYVLIREQLFSNLQFKGWKLK